MADKDYDSDDSEVEQVAEPTPEEPEEDITLTNPDVVTKYQEAAKIAQAVLIEVAAKVRTESHPFLARDQCKCNSVTKYPVFQFLGCCRC